MRRAGARPAALLLALAVCATAPRSAAEEAQRVSVLDGESRELGRKLRAEIAYAGFSALDGAGVTSRVPATILVLSAERVQLSVQRASDGTSVTLVLERAPGEGDSFALRVVEALRARLVDVGWTLPAAGGSRSDSEPAPAAAEAPAAEAAPEVVAPPESQDALSVPEAAPSGAGPTGSEGLRLWLGAGAMGSWSPGGLGITPQAALSLRAELDRSWGAALLAQLPLRDGELEADEGEARVAWSSLSASVERRLALSEPWLCHLGLGAGLFVLDGAGEAQQDFSGRRERLTVGAGFLALGIGRELGDWLRVRSVALLGAAAPRPVLRFAGREVASLGTAFASLGLQLELSWPTSQEAEP